MHPRNPYITPPDFRELAIAYPPLSQHLVKPSNDSEALSINFKDASAQRTLTEALLHRDFGLRLVLPEGRLCPPVPNRLNYLLWIRDVVEASGLGREEQVVGIDIGIGASAIYPLLGCKLCESWSFVGTEIDDVSYESAIANIARNGLSERVRVVKAKEGEKVLSPLFDDVTSREIGTKYTFTMCNPPFYSSAEDVAQSNEAKFFGPHSICIGADTEIITPGGEVAFVGQMVKESCEAKARDRCLWFTSMLGKHSSVARIVGLLRERNVDNYALTELVQGQTRRWVVAWSFGDVRLPDSIARSTSSSFQSSLPLPNSLRHPFPGASSEDELWSVLREAVGGIEGLVTEEEGTKMGSYEKTMEARQGGLNRAGRERGRSKETRKCLRVRAWSDTWSRSARRKKRKREQEDEVDSLGGDAQTLAGILEVPSAMTANANANIHQTQTAPALVCEITVVTLTTDNTGTSKRSITPTSTSAPMLALECTWTRGQNRTLFEGFWGRVCWLVGERQAVAVVEEGVLVSRECSRAKAGDEDRNDDLNGMDYAEWVFRV